ncbi:MAG: Fe-S cluster assembly ATPase SufC [Cytophagales bacterium]|nr:Fe-S cluster assembly ATPase SufC [Cytophagales bacterium]
MLSIKDLHVSAEDKPILKGLNLSVNAGEVHAIMGPNGSGKSTMASFLAGREGYHLLRGKVQFKGKDLLSLAPEERAGEGLFLAFQYPVEIPGLGSLQFLKTALQEIRKYRAQEKLKTTEFMKIVHQHAETMGIAMEMLTRPLNEGFSGGEKKRHEIFQMAVLSPSLSILDETDSGLDIDALRTVAKGVNALRAKKNAMILITHYQRLLDYIVPDKVHILFEGQIIKSGSKLLAQELEKKGYEELIASYQKKLSDTSA